MRSPRTAHSACKPNKFFYSNAKQYPDKDPRRAVHLCGSCLRRRAAAPERRCGLPRRVAADRKARRGRTFADDPRREGRHPACAVEILLGGRSPSGHPRGVVHRRPSRHSSRGSVGRVGAGRLDERFLHGFPGPDVPRRDVESRDVGPLRQIHRRGGPLPREGHPAGPGREHLPHAAERP